MIKVINYRGRLGNNLFQYTFSRILADLTGKKLLTKSFVRVPEIKSIEGHIDNQMLLIKDCEENEGLIYDLEKLKNVKHGFAIDGFFQNKIYYESRRIQIKKWLFDVPNLRKDTVAVHIRLTDYLDLGWELPNEYYDQCIKNSMAKNILIFTDDPKNSYVKKLLLQGAKLSNEKYDIDDLKSMASCEKIIMSRSSFSWWAAFLSNAKEIYFPRPSSGMWSLKDTPHKDLFLDYDEYKLVNL